MDNGQKYNTITDCVVDVRKGIDGAFDVLYSMSYPYAYSAASHLLKSKEDIEDALQNSFYYVSKNISDLRDNSAYLKWLNVIVINECKKIIINQSKQNKIFFAEKHRLIVSGQSRNVENEQTEKTDLVETINSIIDDMKPKKREILKLYYFDNLSYSEISEKLDIPVGTVMSRLYNAKRELEKKVKELQKNGTVLWSLPVLPFVAALLSYNVKAPVSAGAAAQISTGVASSAATSTSAAIGSSAATASAASAGTTTIGGTIAGAGSSIAVKAATVALATSVAVGSGAAAKAIIKNNTDDYSETPVFLAQENLNDAFDDMFTTLNAYVYETTDEVLIQTSAQENSLKQNTTLTEAVTTVQLAVANSADNSFETSHKSSQRHEKRTTRSKTTASVSSTAELSETTTEQTTKETTTEKEAETTQEAKAKTDSEVNNAEKQSQTTVNPYAGMSVNNGVLNQYNGIGGSVTVPSSLNGQSITAIGASAFESSDVTAVSISPGITKIGQMAFSDCNDLSSVSLPATLTSIGDCAFDGCSSLKTITIPDSVTNIGDDAFDGCNNITIRCSEGSAAYYYAIQNSIDYELI
ncbi:MAG: sigma-70 family RNA polymerase sigma factor [Clostridia bacterium]|nr:sigma-70 family RNA polymerase sigma factor [Clostridia bacterium]